LRTPTGSLDAKQGEALATIARRHIALAQPRILLLFGDACSKALVGPAVAGARGRWHELATPAGAVKTLVTIKPEKLVAMPKLKAHAWADLQLLMEELTP
jgi:DNA polymerase